MSVMSRWQKQKTALQQTIVTLRKELQKTQQQLSKVQASAETLAATQDFCKDGKNVLYDSYHYTLYLHIITSKQTTTTKNNHFLIFTDKYDISTQTEHPPAEDASQDEDK